MPLVLVRRSGRTGADLAETLLCWLDLGAGPCKSRACVMRIEAYAVSGPPYKEYEMLSDSLPIRHDVSIDRASW